MSLVSSFETRVNVNIVEGLCKLGYFEKEGLSLALGTTSWNVVILSPYETATSPSASVSSSALKKRLAINRDITCIETAQFQLNQGNHHIAAPEENLDSHITNDSGNEAVDILLIGTSTNLLAYNVQTNSDIFYKDVPDGVNCILFVSKLPHIASTQSSSSLVIVGGNCSIQAFDELGEEVFWTVTSDNVNCMILCDIDRDGIDELLVGSQDCTIKAFKGEQVVYSVHESEVVTHLQSLGKGRFAYSLSNGTLGVYVGNKKLWSIHSKQKVTAMNIYDISYAKSSSDGARQSLWCLIVGWNHGLIEARTIENGKVVWSNFINDGDADYDENDDDDDDDDGAQMMGIRSGSGNRGGGVAGIVCGNLRSRSNNRKRRKTRKNAELITVSSKGSITAWIPKANSPKADTQNTGNNADRTSSIGQTIRRSFIGGNNNNNDDAMNRPEQMASIEDLVVLEALQAERNELSEQFVHLRTNWQKLKRSKNSEDPSLIPTNTEIACTLTPSIEKGRLLLIMNSNNSTVIKCAVIYGDKVFENGSFMLSQTLQPKSRIILPLKFEKDLQCTLSIKAIVGHLSSTQNHVFELSHRIPRFASYLYVPSASIATHDRPQSYVEFVLPERVGRLILWLNQAFLLEYENSNKKQIDISFVSLRNRHEYLTLHVEKQTIKIWTDNLSLAGDIVQDICQYLSITELDSVCVFEQEFKALQENLQNVEQFNEIRNRLSIDIASNTAIIKNLIVQSQDCRAQKQYAEFKKQYVELYDMNQEMIAEFLKRQNNHQNLMDALKSVNQTIQRVSRLRLGKYQKMTVNAARAAVKKKNIKALINALRSSSNSQQQQQQQQQQ